MSDDGAAPPAAPVTTASARRDRPAGMAAVARLAGVSHQTVSRVLNEHPSVRPSTRERVLAAMVELDYRPNRLARALVTSRSGIIGVVTSGSARYGPSSTLMAVEEAARGAGFAANVTAVREDDSEALATRMAQTLLSFDSQAVEGVIVIAPRVSTVEALQTISSRAPLLLIAAGVAPSPRFGVVGVDQAQGARAATAHLLALGHTSIGHLAGPADWFDSRERHRGWLEELEHAGVTPGPVWEGDWTADVGYDVGRRLLADPDRPTAVVASNDQMALGLLRAFGEGGLDVPGDVSVTGFDDIEGTAHFRPPLTTVRQDFAALGEAAMAEMLRLIAERGGRAHAGADDGAAAGAGVGVGGVAPIPAELVVRSSTGAAKPSSEQLL
ncbi:LacI family DNA-binding transcriptional regulator [Serinibacter arcticus]|uniref:Transcriptional regulator, LacI family n=1 Tax=Serinibacter arcticus TaxID=1655435 RepID=A0A4Z1E822_9MICO|nr:LacI family DNA-binding transcriptional regulator [Serinibacter arcticus]TGO05737.1 Transcriptional regulator, LacI family [Serinibacter arcticus]